MKILKLTTLSSELRLFVILDQIAFIVVDDHGNSEITLTNGEKLCVQEDCNKILLKIVELQETEELVMC